MGSIVVHVRRCKLLLVLLAPATAVNAQVAIQVKNGTTWTSNVELSALAQLTFRWRWDGTETPSGVAWQLATVTPTSTATTRATDVIASETPMKLPAKGGVYEEFVVTPAPSWPAKVYVRVRVNIGRKSVYSRWATVSVVPVKSSFVGPTCAISARKKQKSYSDVPQTVPDAPVNAGETVQAPYGYAVVLMIVQNPSRTEASYRQFVSVLKNGVNQKAVLINEKHVDPSELDPTLVRRIGAGKADTLTLGGALAGIALLGYDTRDWFYEVDGISDEYETFFHVMPIEGSTTKCSLRFFVK